MNKCLDYYSAWTGVDLRTLMPGQVAVVESPVRDQVQKGYSRKFDLYYLIGTEYRVLSYNGNCKPFVPDLQTLDSIDAVAAYLAAKGSWNVAHEVKFAFEHINDAVDYSEAVALKSSDYPLFDVFMQKRLETESSPDWVREYFLDMVQTGSVWGIVRNGGLVSVAEAPSMPFMENELTEIGVETVDGYKRQGLAEKVCTAFIADLLKKGREPIWSCDAGNLASIRLAEKAGFRKLFDVFTVTIE